MARTTRVIVAKTNDMKIKLIGEKKRIAVKTLIIKTLEYSAIKIKANNPALYSTLKPDTNSASPSGKSKGARFVSAKIEIIQGIIRGKNTNLAIIVTLFISINENEDASKLTVMIIKIILTSYEIIWANLRILPSRAYLELEAHPAMIIKYTLILDTQMNIKILNLL